MSRRHGRRLVLGLWGAVAVLAAGVAYDLWWHASNPEAIKTAAEQARVHWLVWLGMALTLAAAVAGARALPGRWYAGFRLLLLVTLAYVGFEVWHFFEHATLRDLDVVHTFLAVAQVAVLGGAISAWVSARRATSGAPAGA